MTSLVETRPGDAVYEKLCTWLGAAALTTRDLAEGEARYYALNDADGAPLGFGGLAGEPPDLLVRSVIVHPAVRRSGVGARLVAALEEQAREQRATALWLLTKGAASFFAHLGFVTVERADAPPSIAASSQFRGLCPASAALMRKPLDGVIL